MSIDQLEGLQEDNVLTVLAWDEQYAPMLALQITPELFSTRAYQKIAEAALQYISKYNAPPRVHLRDVLEDDLKRGEDGAFLNTILKAMDGLQADMQPQFIMDNLDRFIAIRKLTNKATDALDRLHAGDLEAAQEAIADVGMTSDVRPGVFIQDSKGWFSFYDKDEDEETFSSGISILDERGVFPKRKTFFLIMASAGRGKSTWLRQIGVEATLSRKNVLHITLENDLEETLEAYTQTFLGRAQTEGAKYEVPLFLRDEHTRAITGIEMQEIRPGTLHSPAAVKAEFKKIQRRAGRLLVQWFPSRSLTVAQLSSYIDMIKQLYDFVPDMLILDYADEMYIDMANLRTSTGALYRDLRGLGGRRNMAVVTASQTNRQSENARVVGGGMVAEDWSKIGTADMVCTYSQTAAERGVSLARILVYKARRARDKWFALITQSYTTGQFCLDSCFFNKYVEDEVTGYIARRDDPDNEHERERVRAKADAED